MPAPVEQWKVLNLAGPSQMFPEHMWSLTLVTKGTSGQQENQLYTKVYIRRQPTSSREVRMTQGKQMQNLKGWPLCRNSPPLAGAGGTLAQKQASGNLMNHF